MTQIILSPARCQFCHRSEDEVTRLVAGDSAFICSDCVERCAAMLGEEASPEPAARGGERFASQRLVRHFAPLRPQELLATSRTFPIRQQADLQGALDALFGERRVPENFLGLHQQYRHESLSYTKLLEEGHGAIEIGPAQFEDVSIGGGEVVRCLKNGLWLREEGALRYVVVLGQFDDYGRGASQLVVEVAVPPGEQGAALCSRIFETLERRLSSGSCYRGRVLSLESTYAYAGFAQRIRVHDLPPIDRSAVILPESLLEVIERNILRFAEQRPKLRALGMSTQKGLLFHGPPGTGKTHCLRYLAGRLAHHTTLLITAEEMGILPEYMALARLLQPALVVIEDADLIGRQRSERNSACDEVMLNRLLNELDGLREKADVFFILTTNSPATLEPALASRPGRVDQAVEFPLPDLTLRRRIVDLYAASLPLPDVLRDAIAARSEGASPAFLKELLRRIAQQHIEAGGRSEVSKASVDAAMHEMLFTGGVLNARLLGGRIAEGTAAGVTA